VRITNAAARIPRKKLSVLLATVAPRGAGGTPTRVSEVELELEIAADHYLEDLEALFPGLVGYGAEVSTIDTYRGETRTSKAKIDPVNVRIDYRGAVVVEVGNAPVNRKARIDFAPGGTATLRIAPVLKVDGAELVKLAELVEADIRVTISPAQLDLLDSVTLANETKKTIKRIA
jgi:hypothetical protein